MSTIETTAPDAVTEAPQQPILSEKARQLQEVFNVAFNDPNFLNDDKRVEKVLKALGPQDNSDRVINQIRTQVEKEKFTHAAKHGLPNPTEAEILAETKVRYQKHLSRKDKKQVDRSFIEQVKH